MAKTARVYQSGELLTPAEKEHAYRLANLWQAPVFIYISGERTIEMTSEEPGKKKPQETVFPSEKGKPRFLADEPVLYKAMRQSGEIETRERAEPQPVVVDDGSDLV